ncbi:hypothetical protein HPP92_027774, partial [Vanilla planifolia]
MANYLAQFQSIKSSCDRLIIAVEDVSDLWPSVKDGFEERLPLKKALLSNKTRNSVYVENLPAEFILTTDSRLRSRFPQELSVFWFREPYATIVLVTCEFSSLLWHLFSSKSEDAHRKQMDRLPHVDDHMRFLIVGTIKLWCK